jgi:hypothetical protein
MAADVRQVGRVSITTPAESDCVGREVQADHLCSRRQAPRQLPEAPAPPAADLQHAGRAAKFEGSVQQLLQFSVELHLKALRPLAFSWGKAIIVGRHFAPIERIETVVQLHSSRPAGDDPEQQLA